MVFTMAVQLQRSMVIVVTFSPQIACMTQSRQPSSSKEQKVGSKIIIQTILSYAPLKCL